MTFNFIDFSSKTFWLGLLMVAAGILKGLGVPFVGDLIDSIYPNMDSGVLITNGVALMFVKEAIKKSGVAAVALFVGGVALLSASNDASHSPIMTDILRDQRAAVANDNILVSTAIKQNVPFYMIA